MSHTYTAFPLFLPVVKGLKLAPFNPFVTMGKCISLFAHTVFALHSTTQCSFHQILENPTPLNIASVNLQVLHFSLLRRMIQDSDTMLMCLHAKASLRFVMCAAI